MKNIDYIKLYAEKLKNNHQLFSQQKMLIESQLYASSSLFKKMFEGHDFKENARKYLRKRGLI